MSDERRTEYIDLAIGQAEIRKDIGYIKISISEFADTIKGLKIIEIINEQRNIRNHLKWVTKIMVVFGTAIFFLLIGHYDILIDWFKFIFRR